MDCIFLVQNRAAFYLVHVLPHKQCGMLTRHHSNTARYELRNVRTFSLNINSDRGVFRGGIVPWPPLGIARIVKLHRKVSKIEAWPPLCKLGIIFDHTKGMFCAFLLGFGLKIGLNLSEDLFFCSSPNFG